MSMKAAKRSLATSTHREGVGGTTEVEINPMHPEEKSSREPLRLRAACRCGARTRSGAPCRSPAVAGKARCRMHGGARGSGAPQGKANGNYTHGQSTREAILLRRELREMMRLMRADLEDL